MLQIYADEFLNAETQPQYGTHITTIIRAPYHIIHDVLPTTYNAGNDIGTELIYQKHEKGDG